MSEDYSGWVIWLTGLPAAGKTTIASRLHGILRSKGIRAEHLDGDEIRKVLSAGLGFSRQDRDANIQRVGYLCQLLSRNGVTAIVSAVSPYREARDRVRASVGKFLEVYVKCSLEVCERRDPKGLYKKAREGTLLGVTGVSDPYEEPLAPEAVVETEKDSAEQCAAKILAKLGELSAKLGSVYTQQEEKDLMEKLASLGYLE